MFVSSGIFAYRESAGSSYKKYEVCLECCRIKVAHGYHNDEPCIYDGQLFWEYATFERRDLEFKDLEHFFFRRHQYLSEKEL